jgi:hypothetical protein
MRDNSQRREPPSVDGVALRLRPLRVVTAEGAAMEIVCVRVHGEAGALGLTEFRPVMAGAEAGHRGVDPRAAACSTVREAKAAAKAETYLKVADMELLLFLGGSPAYAHPDAEKMAHPKPYVRLRNLTGLPVPGKAPVWTATPFSMKFNYLIDRVIEITTALPRRRPLDLITGAVDDVSGPIGLAHNRLKRFSDFAKVSGLLLPSTEQYTKSRNGLREIESHSKQPPHLRFRFGVEGMIPAHRADSTRRV